MQNISEKLDLIISKIDPNLSSSIGGVGGANWTNVSKQLVGAIIAQAIFVVVGLLCRFATIKRLNDRDDKLRHSLLKHIGTAHDPPAEPAFLALCFLGQFTLSTLTCIIWVIHVYKQNVESWMKTAYIIFATFAAVHYFINALKAKFHPSYFWTMSALIDSLTLAPMLMTSDAGYAWINLAFLRMYRANLAVERLEDAGVMSHMTEFQISILWLLVRTITLMSLFAASIFCAEVLGPFKGDNDDSYVATAMGDISLFQMLYWVLTTISTVGYGDYAPTTMLARALTMVCIIAGVAFFSVQTGEVLRISELEKAGLGSFAKSTKPHIIVCGKAVHRDSGILVSFLAECLHPDKPVIRVLLVSDKSDPGLLPSLRGEDTLKGLQCGQISHLVGSVITRNHQIRFGLATAAMVVVLGDSATANAEADGEVNLLQALAILRARPNIPLRLMLLTPRCRRNAIAAGIPPFFCISLDEVMTNLMAHSCLCIGYSSMVMNLFMSDRPDQSSSKLIEEPWLHEYMHGMSMEVYGFSNDHPTQTFALLAQEIYDDHAILLLGCQIDGRVQLAPMHHMIEPGTICFALAKGSNELDPIHDGSDWAVTCRKRRNESFVSSDIKHVIAGWELNEISSRSGVGAASSKGRRAQALQNADDYDDDLTTSQETLTLPQFPRRAPLVDEVKHNKRVGRISDGRKVASPKHDGPREIYNTATLQSRAMSSDQLQALDDTLALGSHIVVLALGDDPWAQVHTFAKMINRPESQCTRNIVVLFQGDNVPSASMQASLDAQSVHLLEGSAQEPGDLIRAGITNASAIVSLAGQPFPGENPKAADASTAVATLLVEKLIFQETGQDQFAIFEWIFPPNVGLIPRHPLCILPKPGFRDNGPANDDGLAEEFDLLHSVRYASGRVISGVLCGALCAQAYFTPGVMEVFDQLVYANGGVIPFQIGLPSNCIGQRWDVVFRILMHEFGERMLPLGVMRAPYDLDSSLCSFMVTNPQPTMIMRSDDLVTVLAKPEFVKWYNQTDQEEEENVDDSWANDFVQDVKTHVDTLVPVSTNDANSNPLCTYTDARPDNDIGRSSSEDFGMEIEADRPFFQAAKRFASTSQVRRKDAINVAL